MTSSLRSFSAGINQRSKQAFLLALMEMAVNGVSTRKVSGSFYTEHIVCFTGPLGRDQDSGTDHIACSRYGNSKDVVEEGFDDAGAVLALPERYRRRLRTTNSVERLNEKIGRREKVIRIFLNRESAMRLIGAVLLDIDNKWAGGRKYFDMDEYYEYLSHRQPSPKICYL